MKKPNSALKSKVARGERPNRTNVHHIAGIRIVERSVLKCSDCNVVAPAKKLHLACLSYVVKKPYTTRTKHTSFLIQHNHRAEINDFSLADFHAQRDLAGVQAVNHVVVL